MINLHGISRESFDLIVGFEVSGKAAYDKQYRRPERPGGQSGITVGIGYDCGYASASDIRRDWGGKIPAAMVAALVAVAGLKGAAAQKALAGVRPKVDIPWVTAIDVFSNVSIPKYMTMARKGLPGFDDLTPDCKGALLSLVYNRGASFSAAGARYVEMRAIRAAMVSGDLAEIPAQLRKMRRLWTTPSVRGVALRREQEARLFERGLKASAGRIMAEPDVEVVDIEPEDSAPAPAADPRVPTSEFDPALLSIQTDLKAMNYSPGIPSGKWGGMTAGAIAGFINDYSSATTAPASYDDFAGIRSDLLEEVAEAKGESFKRPVTEARATADPKTVAEVAPESVPVKRGFWAAIWAAITTAFASVWDWISTNVSAAWDFFTDNRDSIPTDHGFLSTAWSYVTAVPPVVWGLALCGVFIFLALNLRSAGNQITESVTTGARQ